MSLAHRSFPRDIQQIGNKLVQTSFDTFDWEIGGGEVTADVVLAKFQSIIDTADTLDTGFMTLSHDLSQQVRANKALRAPLRCI